MNTTIFWRLVWKEYRQQQALWIAIAVAGLIFSVGHTHLLCVEWHSGSSEQGVHGGVERSHSVCPWLRSYFVRRRARTGYVCVSTILAGRGHTSVLC